MRPATIGFLGVCVAILGGVRLSRASQDVPQQIKHGTASWYSNASAKREGTCHVGKRGGCLTASGKELNDEAFTAASWDYSFGTLLTICRDQLSSNKSQACIMVEVADRGPSKHLYRQGRLLDLSEKSFAALADLKEGVIKITVEAIPSLRRIELTEGK